MFSLVTPGHLLISPGLFLDYRHLVEYIYIYIYCTPNPLLPLGATILYPFGIGLVTIVGVPSVDHLTPLKALGVHVEDPFVFIFPHNAISIDEPLPTVNISYATLTGNFYYTAPCKDGLTVQVQLTQLTWNLHVNSFYLPHNPCINRWCVTFSHGHLTTLNASLNPTLATGHPLLNPLQSG